MHRDERSILWLEQIRQDISYSLRQCRRSPGFTAAVVLTLALGIGMNAAVFSVVDAVFFSALPYPNANRLVWIATYDKEYESETDVRLLPGDYAAFQKRAVSFDTMTAYSNKDLALAYQSQSAAERVASITGDFWRMTGARPAFGRLTTNGERNAIVLSWPLFERRFASNQRVVGRTVSLEGHPFQIIGVLPASFRFEFPQFLYPDDEHRSIDAYISVPNEALSLPMEAYKGTNWDEVVQNLGPTPDFVWVVAGLRPGASPKRGKAELETIYKQLAKEKPNIYHTHDALRVQSLHDKLTGNARAAFFVLGGAAVFVLLIVCVNVANLLLARSSSRQREIALRRALGAGRSRLLQQLFTESITFALSGAAAGLALAAAITKVLAWLGSAAVPRVGEAKIDVPVLLFTLSASLLATVLFGFAPAASLLADATSGPLKETGATTSASAGRLRARAALVTIEMLLAVALLSGAGLMLKSFQRMNELPAGFSPDRIVTLNISLSGAQYRTWPEQHAYIDELFRQLGNLPGTEATGVLCSTFNTNIRVEKSGSETFTPAAIEYVSSGYLPAMGARLLRGAWPTEGDIFDRVIVNESFARKAGGDDNVIGRRIHAPLFSAVIGGVVPDFKSSQLDAEPGPAIYAAYQLSPRISFITVAVRVTGDHASAIAAIRKRVSAIDPNVPVYRIQTLEQELSDSIGPRRFNTFLLTAFSVAALALALLGVYGVLAYLVAQRTREIGIRIALGASRGEVMALIIWKGMFIVLTGITAGLLLAVGLGRFMAGMLYGVRPNDPSTLLVVTGALTLAALLACCGPAWKAARIDPIYALRHE